MYARINGKTYRRGCDVSILMASVDGSERRTSRQIGRRIAKYRRRAEQGRDIFTNRPISAEDMEVARFAEIDLEG